MAENSAAPPRSSIFRRVMSILVVLLAAGGIYIYGIWAENKRVAAEATRAEELKPIVALAQKLVLADADLSGLLGEKPQAQKARSEGQGELNTANTMVLFNLVGPKGTIPVAANAQQVDGNWRLTKVVATLPEGKTKELTLAADDAPPELNFDAGN